MKKRPIFVTVNKIFFILYQNSVQRYVKFQKRTENLRCINQMFSYLFLYNTKRLIAKKIDIK